MKSDAKGNKNVNMSGNKAKNENEVKSGRTQPQKDNEPKRSSSNESPHGSRPDNKGYPRGTP